MGERIAVYPGSFDPPTNGHFHTLERSCSLFDVIHVLIAKNPDKEGLLSPVDRAHVFESYADMLMKGPNIEPVVKTAILPEDLATVQFAHDVGATFLIRGLRSEMDFSYEQGMQHANAKLSRELGIPELETVFLSSPLNDDLFTSSSLVRNLMKLRDWERAVMSFVPGDTMQLLRRQYAHAHSHA